MDGRCTRCTVWLEPIWKKVNTSQLLLPQHQSTYPRGPESASIEIPPFRPHFIKHGDLDRNTYKSIHFFMFYKLSPISFIYCEEENLLKSLWNYFIHWCIWYCFGGFIQELQGLWVRSFTLLHVLEMKPNFIHWKTPFSSVMLGGFHLHLLVFPFVYQFNSRIGVLVHSSFAND